MATEVVKQLLEKGYNVRGTVRSLSSEEKIEHLQLLGEALPGKLTLHEADLLKPGSFDELVKGADFVFHTASPFFRWDTMAPGLDVRVHVEQFEKVGAAAGLLTQCLTCRDVQDPMKDLVEPAVHGTQNVLSSVAKSKDTVKRIIQTSSFAGKASRP